MGIGQKFPLKKIALMFVIGLAALGLRLLFWEQSNSDLRVYVLKWVQYITAHGGFSALADTFSNYSPPYTYFLVLISGLPWLPAATGVKLVSVIFDYAIALTASAAIPGRAGVLAYALCLFSPVVFLESAAWGQCDGIYTLFLLLGLAAFLKQKNGWGFAFISIAFSFKAQAVFLGAVVLVVFLLRFKWKYLLIPPAAFLAMMLPALAAGRSLWSILMVYPGQAGTYNELTKNAPNLYTFVSNQLYDVLYPAGMILTALTVVALVIITLLRRRRLDGHGLVLLAVFSLLLIPFILPKMHERYFYPAAVFSLLLPFTFRRLWPATLLLQVATWLSYLPFLYKIPVPLPLLALLNLAALVILGIAYGRHLFPTIPESAQKLPSTPS